jgi:hypothetical protein
VEHRAVAIDDLDLLARRPGRLDPEARQPVEPFDHGPEAPMA